jgi:hypothetical protein
LRLRRPPTIRLSRFRRQPKRQPRVREEVKEIAGKTQKTSANFTANAPNRSWENVAGSYPQSTMPARHFSQAATESRRGKLATLPYLPSRGLGIFWLKAPPLDLLRTEGEISMTRKLTRSSRRTTALWVTYRAPQSGAKPARFHLNGHPLGNEYRRVHIVKHI